MKRKETIDGIDAWRQRVRESRVVRVDRISIPLEEWDVLRAYIEELEGYVVSDYETTRDPGPEKNLSDAWDRALKRADKTKTGEKHEENR
jgi:hypothetical protein